MRLGVLSLPTILALSACGGGGGGGGDGGAATPPSALPAAGPGSATYPYASVVETTYGSGDTQYWLYEPSSPGPSAKPVIVFCHGWGALVPDPYLGWLEHLARRGNVVIFPKYQSSLATSPSTFTDNAVAAIEAALVELASGPHAVVDLARVAVAGHSFGGVVAANLAARAAAEGLPAFLALLCANPGTNGFQVYEDYANIPAGTLLLAITGEDDNVVITPDAKRIFLQSTAIPLADKDFVTLRTDAHGTPSLVSNHNASLSGVSNPPDAFDGYAYWKWFDALSDAAFFGTNRVYALGDTPEQRFMGVWSDAQPVTEPVVTDAP